MPEIETFVATSSSLRKLLPVFDWVRKLMSPALRVLELEDATPEQLFITAVLPTRQQVPHRVCVFLDQLEASLSSRK